MKSFISYKAYHKFPGRASLELLKVFVEYDYGHRLQQRSFTEDGGVRRGLEYASWIITDCLPPEMLSRKYHQPADAPEENSSLLKSLRRRAEKYS